MRRFWLWLAAVAIVTATLADVVDARSRRPRSARRPVATAAVRNPELPPVGAYRSALLIDADTGATLYEHDAQRVWPQASLVKMMVALLAFEAIAAGEIDADEPVRISRYASAMGGSQVFLRPGETIALSELLKAMLIASANDASAAVAEAIGGSPAEALDLMNRRARELGMSQTTYATLNGLPPARRGAQADVASARDLALLARRLLEIPEVLEVTSRSEVTFRGGRTRLHNTNHLVGRTAGVDGLKTGYYRMAGFNLIATASRDGMRLVAIVLGCPTLRSRFNLAEDLLEWGYANYSRLELVRAGEPLAFDVRVSNGSTASLRPVAGRGSSFLIRRGEAKELEVSFQVPATVAAPISANQALGEIIVRDGSEILAVIPAVAPRAVADLGTSSP